MTFGTACLTKAHKDLADFFRTEATRPDSRLPRPVRLTPCRNPRPISGTGTLDLLQLCASGCGRSFTRLRAYFSQEDANLHDSCHTDLLDKTAEVLRAA